MSLNSFPNSKSARYGVICFSHLRWNFVFQRPQHLLSRFANHHDVLVIEEPVFHDGENRFEINGTKEGVEVVVPHLANGTSEVEIDGIMKGLVEKLVAGRQFDEYIAWYYTPMMLPWSEGLKPVATVYDCMDELSAFKNAPEKLKLREAELFGLADLVFTGGRSLYDVKREQHDSVYCFPSSIDVKHFGRALDEDSIIEPEDQKNIAKPRVGFFGVIDERTDIDLLGETAKLRPDWQFIMIGPVVKIDEKDLPRGENIHYLGGKSYDELPNYIAGWNVAMMPFALNESTRFISPTKTPEYLAAGRPVVSTAIQDVVRPYGEAGLVKIAGTADEFAEAIDAALHEDAEERRRNANEFLETMSWDKTYAAMSELIDDAIAENANQKPYFEKSV